MTIQSFCLVCGTPTATQCSSCKSATYCSKEHQKKDWRTHKEYCLKVKAAGANTFNAILFPVDEIKPRLVKIPWELRHNEDDGQAWQKLDKDMWFKHPDTFVRSADFDRLGINGPELGRRICLKYDDNFMINGSPSNRCIVHITRGNAGHHWCGNVLGLRMDSSFPYSSDFYKSVDMEEDLKLFVTYFEEYGKVMPESSRSWLPDAYL